MDEPANRGGSVGPSAGQGGRRNRAAVVIVEPDVGSDLDLLWDDVARAASDRAPGGGGGLERARSRWLAVWSEADHRAVALCDGVPLGVVAARMVDSGPWTERGRLGGATVHVTLLHVMGHGRRLGVGHALLADVVAYADQQGAELMAVDVPPDLGRVNRFYARLGFAPVTTRRIASVSALRRKFTVEPVARRRLLRRRAGSS